MKLFRYMSEREFALLTAGVEIVGKRRFNARTTSSGVCFLAETVEIFRDSHDLTVSPQWCFKFLHGVVSGDVLVEFECDAPERVRESEGIYADPLGDYYDTLAAVEFCTPRYDRTWMRPVAYYVYSNDWRRYEYEESN